MNNSHVSVPRFLTRTIFALLVFSTIAAAQFPEPDERIRREMIAYIAKIERASQSIISPIAHPLSKPTAAIRRKTNSSENEGRASGLFALERRAFDIVNRQRAEAGLPALVWNEDMARAARLHSANMAHYKFFSHTGIDGSKVGDRAKSFTERTWYAIGENIAFNQGFKLPVESACQQWMNSPGHRANLLARNWRASGIGAAIASDGSFYITQVFVD